MGVGVVAVDAEQLVGDAFAVGNLVAADVGVPEDDLEIARALVVFQQRLEAGDDGAIVAANAQGLIEAEAQLRIERIKSGGD